MTDAEVMALIGRRAQKMTPQLTRSRRQRRAAASAE